MTLVKFGPAEGMILTIQAEPDFVPVLIPDLFPEFELRRVFQIRALPAG
jgi:hypothetical protein